LDCAPEWLLDLLDPLFSSLSNSNLGGERGVLESVSTSMQGGMAARKEDAIGASSTGSGAVVSAGADSTGGSGGTVVELPAARKSADTFGQRTSIYRGVTR
jgi:hypothetical protein